MKTKGFHMEIFLEAATPLLNGLISVVDSTDIIYKVVLEDIRRLIPVS